MSLIHLKFPKVKPLLKGVLDVKKIENYCHRGIYVRFLSLNSTTLHKCDILLNCTF